MNPAKSFLPKEFQVKEVHMGNLAYLVAFLVSPSFFSTTGLLTYKVANSLVEVDIKSQILTPYSVPAATHYNLGLNAI